MLPEDLRISVTSRLEALEGPTEIKSFSFASGGCINSAGKLETRQSEYFIKWNNRTAYPGMFEAEFKGLELLSAHCDLKIPQPLFFGEVSDIAYIVMEQIESYGRGPGYWEELGRGLAKLHSVTEARFGLDHANYIGSLPQENHWEDNWSAFFFEHRLQPQFKMAIDSGKLKPSINRAFDSLNQKLESILPEKIVPSLVHGDLWNGNLMTGNSGEPVIIDPAVYFGNREMDLAMTRLFGGFDLRFYDSYEEAWPLPPGFDERQDICNLYPLLVHVNLFGGGYIQQVESILRRF